MDTLQFFPTPRKLARQAWALFKNRDFRRVLDPEAGNGDLCDAAPRDYYERAPKIDCIEIDAGKHPALRDKGYRIVGLDFLAFEGGHCYTHVIMNPPFLFGAHHTLKAWDMLYEGEIVAILNAETVRNPHTAERRRLAELIERHGGVKFIHEAFKGRDVEREADVEIALVHLEKPAECSSDWIGPILQAMAVDRQQPPADIELPGELALPANFVSTQVTAFRLAVKAMRESARMQAVANHYAARIGRTLVDLQNERGESNPDEKPLGRQMEEGYDTLKDRAWASVLRSTETLKKLSSKVQQQAESQFEQIKALDFTEANVFSFLLGLAQSQPDMQMDMVCEVFDLITRYWSENTVFYRGWKSNDKHRSMGKRVKMTRIILPHMTSWSHSLEWRATQVLADFDKVFALLDGKREPQVSLVSLFSGASYQALRQGDRLDARYFSVRFHKGVGTVHLFPRNKDLVDRLNRTVGRRRDWLPPVTEEAGEAFWKQYDQAEKLDAQLQEELRTQHRARAGYHGGFHHPAGALASNDPEDVRRAEATRGKAMDAVLQRNGLLQAITSAHAAAQPLLLAA